MKIDKNIPIPLSIRTWLNNIGDMEVGDFVLCKDLPEVYRVYMGMKRRNWKSMRRRVRTHSGDLVGYRVWRIE